MAADVRLIVDVSASMGRADPDNRRGEALGMLLRMLPDDGRAGVWTYGQFVNMLVKHGPSDGLWKENAVILTSDLASVGRRSNLLDAIDQASWDRRPGAAPAHLIVLTDGRLDVADDARVNEEQRRRLLTELAPELAAAGFRVHTLALSDRADTELLAQLASLTGGYHGRLESPLQLPEGLLSLLGWVSAPAALSVSAAGSFQVAPGIRELIVLRLGGGLDQPVALVDPTGARLERTTPRTRVRWHVAEGYEMVSLQRPAPGVWRFEGAGAGGHGRVFAYGDLSLAYADLPGTLFPGGLRSFDLTLRSGEDRVADPEFLDLLQVSARLTGPDGALPLVVEGEEDGRFRVNLLGPHVPGDYRLETRVWGPTFAQTLALPLALRNPLAIEIRPLEDGLVLWTRVQAAELDHDRLRLSAMVKRPPGAARLFPLERRPAGLWKLTVPGARGVVEIELDIQGNYLNERPFVLRTQPIRVVLPVTAVQYVNLGLDGRPALVATPPGAPADADWDRDPLGLATASDAAPVAPAETAAAARPPSAGDMLVRDEAPPADQGLEAVLPVWLAIAAALLNLLLGVSVWWLVGAARAGDSRDGTLANLRARLGVSDPESDPQADAHADPEAANDAAAGSSSASAVA